jgi:hypothetical protein
MPPETEAPPPSDARVERWDPAPGSRAVPVLAWRAGECLNFQFGGFARYRFDPAAHLCSATAFAGASEGQMIDTYQRAVLPMILQQRGVEVMHASAIDTNPGVVAFAAPSGTGKTTLAAHFAANENFEVWADDAVAWTVEKGAIVSHWLPFLLRVGSDASAYVPLADRSRKQRPLAAIVVMERSGALAEPGLTRIARSSEALSCLLPHAYCFSAAEKAANKSLISNHLSLIASVPVYRLAFPPRHELIAATGRMLEEVLRLCTRIEHQEGGSGAQ